MLLRAASRTTRHADCMSMRTIANSHMIHEFLHHEMGTSFCEARLSTNGKPILRLVM